MCSEKDHASSSLTVRQLGGWRTAIVERLARYLTPEQTALLYRSKEAAWSSENIIGSACDSPAMLLIIATRHSLLPCPAAAGGSQKARRHYWCEVCRQLPGSWIDVDEWRLGKV